MYIFIYVYDVRVRLCACACLKIKLTTGIPPNVVLIQPYLYRMYTSIYIHVCAYIHTYIHTYIYYITLHYITLHYITLHYITLHYITLHYITLHYITLHSYIHTYIYIYIFIYVYYLRYVCEACGVHSETGMLHSIHLFYHRFPMDKVAMNWRLYTPVSDTAMAGVHQPKTSKTTCLRHSNSFLLLCTSSV